MSHLPRLQRLAGILYWIAAVLIVAIPVVLVIGIALTPLSPALVDVLVSNVNVSPAAEPWQLGLSIALNSLLTLVFLWTLNKMRHLFGRYRAGHVLTDDCALLIQQIGTGFTGMALLPFILNPIQSVLLSWANGAGERQLSISFSSDMIGFALAGGLLILIGWAMRDAANMATENRSFV